jgi:protein gp37
MAMKVATIHWSPILGCSIASTGCANCHAMRAPSARLLKLVTETAAGPVWTGQVRFSEALIDHPRMIAKPRHFAVCSTGDLFHENVPVGWLDRVFAVMAATPWHSYEILTKRPRRMQEYVALLGTPLANVSLGTSAERQAEADERLPVLLATPAARRFIAFYPLLGPIDVRAALGLGYRSGIDFAGIGDEQQRPMQPAWAASLRKQLARLGIPCTTVKPDAKAA